MRSGRRKGLLLSIFINFIGYILCALAISQRWLFVLFVGRGLMGLGSGNMSICLSAISDISTSKKMKNKYFGYGSALAGLTFVLGPIIGGKLSDPAINPLFTPSFPMWIGGGLAFINFLFILLAFVETGKITGEKGIDFNQGIKNIQTAFNTRNLKQLYLVYFFYLFAWNIFFQFVPAVLVSVFNSSNSAIGNVCALMGVCWVIGSGAIARLFHSSSFIKKVLLYCFFLFAIFTTFLQFAVSLVGFISLLAVCTLISGVIWPLCTTEISNGADQAIQGKILGFTQSVLSVSMVSSAILGGLFLNVHIDFPFTIAALAVVTSGLIYLRK